MKKHNMQVCTYVQYKYKNFCNAKCSFAISLYSTCLLDSPAVNYFNCDVHKRKRHKRDPVIRIHVPVQEESIRF